MSEPSKPKPFRVEVEVRADGETVWQALTDLDQIGQWFGWDYEGLDGEIRYIFVEHATAHPPNLLEGDNGHRIEIEPVAESAGPPGAPPGAVVVRAVLPGSLDDADWADIYDALEEGWRAFFEQLRFWLERRPAGRRRTVYLTGRARGDHVLASVERGGETWHESRYLRMHVDPAGHLVAVAAQQPLTGPDAGPVSITLTTYGLDDAAFAAVRQDWAARWREIVEDPEVTTRTGTVSAAGPGAGTGADADTAAGAAKSTGKAGPVD